MNRTKKIENILKKEFSDFSLNIIDDSDSHIGHDNFNGNGETHIIVELERLLNFKINRLEIHKKINFLLKEEFKLGLHSLQIKII
tara:strand:- start:42 stop:296 length:255 start_codon:yes stop_codon:yes gene_type:complete